MPNTEKNRNFNINNSVDPETLPSRQWDEEMGSRYDPVGDSEHSSIPIDSVGLTASHEVNEPLESDMKLSQTNEMQSGLPIERKKTRILSPKVIKLHKKVFLKFLQTVLVLSAFLICILSIYWGSQYNESHFMHKVNVLVVIQDDYKKGQPSLVENIPVLIEEVPCTWHVYNATEYQRKRNIRAAQINEEFLHQVHHQDYWMGLNIKPNATNYLIRSLNNATVEPFNFSNYFQAVFESGRDPSTMKTAILPNMQRLERLYEQEVVKKYLPRLLSYMNDSVVTKNLIGASNVHFDYWDYRSFYDPVILSPLQVGLIYCLLLTFFQLGFYAPVHKEMVRVLKLRSMIFYRIAISILTYFLLSLFFCTLSAIFQIDFTKGFGRGGFIVYWMTTWLLMAALGGANENAASIIGLFGFQYMGLWLMTWIVLNISPAFYPLVSNSYFYRYGYMMPIPNAVEIFKVIFLNTSKHSIGRNYGIICAWIGLNTCLFPIVMFLVVKVLEKREKIAKAEIEGSEQKS